MSPIFDIYPYTFNPFYRSLIIITKHLLRKKITGIQKVKFMCMIRKNIRCSKLFLYRFLKEAFTCSPYICIKHNVWSKFWFQIFELQSPEESAKAKVHRAKSFVHHQIPMPNMFSVVMKEKMSGTYIVLQL